jgi:hypothetical protein
MLCRSAELTTGGANPPRVAQVAVAIVDLDLDELTAMAPPRGYGRD